MLLDVMRCDKCAKDMTACHRSKGRDLELHVWWCQSCGHTQKAIGRERFIQPEDKGRRYS